MEKNEIEAGVLSDHSRGILNLRQYEANRGPGLWKFNNNLASDAEYTKELSELIDQKKMEYDNFNPNKKWELIKYEIRKFTIQYGKKLRKKDKKYEKEFQTHLNRLVLEIDEGRDVEDEISSVKRDLEDLELK